MFTLGKSHKLCSKTAIDRLFSLPHRVTGKKSADGGQQSPEGEAVSTALAFPLRAVWSRNPHRDYGERLQFLISVPKKRLRHAVDRVKMRRRIREAYRLKHGAIIPTEAPAGVDVAFIYVSDTLEPYDRVSKAMRKLLVKIGADMRADQSNIPLQ